MMFRYLTQSLTQHWRIEIWSASMHSNVKSVRSLCYHVTHETRNKRTLTWRRECGCQFYIVLSRGANGHAILGKVQIRMVGPRQSLETLGCETVDTAVEGYSRVTHVLPMSLEFPKCFDRMCHLSCLGRTTCVLIF